MTPAQDTPPLHQIENNEMKTRQIEELSGEEYGHVSQTLSQLLADIADLYGGRWESHQACQVGYHTLTHALDVALATGRMIAGWNRQHQDGLQERFFLCGIAASLFHDTGYIKEKRDKEGNGGKYTFNHVPRSAELAGSYLAAKGWPEADCRLVAEAIGLTEFQEPLELEDRFAERQGEIIARMVATADLISQMSDVNYRAHLDDLFHEFQEAYRAEGQTKLKHRGVRIFSSAAEMIDDTPAFYRNFVLPRLAKLGGMSRYLIVYYGEGRNPYLESIAANLAGDTSGYHLHWRRIGEVFTDLGLVTHEQIRSALEQQDANSTSSEEEQDDNLKGRAMAWFKRQMKGDYLGNILLNSTQLSPAGLRQGVIAQILPTDFTMNLDSRELLLLLHIMILLQNVQNGSWIFNQMLVLINELLECQASSILLADDSGQQMELAYTSDPGRNQTMAKSFAIDKGLAGWVYLHGKPAAIDRQELEEEGPDESAGVEGGTERPQTMLAIPLLIAGKRSGVIEALNKIEGNFTVHDMNLLSLAGNLLSNCLPAALWL